jgi:hypothetical protein
MNNHVIDPTYFYDCIEEFSFDFNLYVLTENDDIDENGYTISKYELQTIRGSLQSSGSARVRSKEGNTTNKEYDFYCKSLYRIKEDDILEYKNNYYICTNINNDYDEYGVRAARLKLISLNTYRDLADYIKYLRGQKLI